MDYIRWLPHTSTHLQSSEHVFGNRVIGIQYAMSWPPGSPDLKPMEIWLWSTEFKTKNWRRQLFKKSKKSVSITWWMSRPLCRLCRKGYACPKFHNGGHFEHLAYMSNRAWFYYTLNLVYQIPCYVNSVHIGSKLL